MNRRQLHHFWRIIRPVSAWYFLGLAVVLLVISFFALRANNLHAISLYKAVETADEKNGDVEGALRNLRAYTYAHMNTSLASETGIKPPIQLRHRYERLVRTEKERVSAYNANVYATAQATCEAQIPRDGHRTIDRVPCVQQYISTHNITEKVIPDGLYKFDFAAPAWSPDLAGLSIVAAGVSAVIFVSRLALELWLRRSLKHHQ
jgi:hypothetical protein